MDTKTACIGFDGYVDSLFRVIRGRNTAGDPEYYETISAFSGRLMAAAGRSADLELKLLERRMGGNAPLMAQALGRLGVHTHCIGAMGYPSLEPEFSSDDISFTPWSVAPAASCTALEFDDGKLMFGHSDSLHTMDWTALTAVLSLEQIRTMYRSCDLWGIVNWSFLLRSNDIIRGFLRDVVEQEKDRTKLVFFDLADPSGRSEEELLELCELLRGLSAHVRVVLGLNENESRKLATVLNLDDMLQEAERAAAIRQKTQCWLVAIHVLDHALGVTAEECISVPTDFVEKPLISTGGGDHFNAGLCTGLLHGMSLKESLSFGNRVSSSYVRTGKSPDFAELMAI